MNNIFINIITHPAFGIITGLLGFLIGNKFATGRDKRKEINQAAATFTSKVLIELEGLYPIPTNWPKDIDRFLRDKFPKLQIALNEFKPFLTQSQQIAFEKTWFIYRMGENGREIDKQDYWQYMPHSGSTIINGVEVEFDNTKSYQDNFKRNVANLLEYAKQK
jgi:hypothetical protein